MSHVLQFSELEYGKGRSFDASIFHPPAYFDLTSVSYCNVHRENRMQGIAYSHSKNGNNSQNLPHSTLNSISVRGKTPKSLIICSVSVHF